MSLHSLRVAIIGGAGGIGGAVARRLRAAGAEVVLLGRTPETLAIVAAEIGAEAEIVDATRMEEMDEVIGGLGRIDGIVNCAGSILLKPAHLVTEAEWAQTVATNLTTAFATVRAGVKAFGNGGGSIVLCATAAARVGLPNHEAIAAAKGGVIGLTLSAAATYAARGIRVNCVAPGLVDTPLAARITGNEAARKASAGMHAMGRIGRPEEVAAGIVFLLDPENSWVTGQVLGIDGGLGTVRGR